MAQATIQGVGGGVTLPTGFKSKFHTWEATLNLSTVDTTGFEDNGYRTREITIADITGTATGTAIKGDTGLTPVPATLLASTLLPSAAKGSIVLTSDTSCTYSFTGVIADVKFTRPIDGKEDLTHSFQSTGAITQAWVTA